MQTPLSAIDTVGVTGDRKALLFCQGNVWKRASSNSVVSFADWSAIYGGKCTVKLRPHSASWQQLCYAPSGNSVGAYLYINGGNELAQGKPSLFDCSKVIGWPDASEAGFCLATDNPLWGAGAASVVPTPGGIMYYDRIAKTTTLYPWQ